MGTLFLKDKDLFLFERTLIIVEMAFNCGMKVLALCLMAVATTTWALSLGDADELEDAKRQAKPPPCDTTGKIELENHLGEMQTVCCKWAHKACAKEFQRARTLDDGKKNATQLRRVECTCCQRLSDLDMTCPETMDVYRKSDDYRKNCEQRVFTESFDNCCTEYRANCQWP